MADRGKKRLWALFAAFVAVGSVVAATSAQELQADTLRKRSSAPSPAPTLRSWMDPELADAWQLGFLGKGTTITVVDDFNSPWGYYGDLGLGTQLLRHGEWTRLEASMIAPSASIRSKDFNTGSTVRLASGKNVLNLSYGMFANAGYNVNQIRWSNQEASIISYATNGKAVISKAAGNDAVAVGGVTSDGLQDYLSLALIGTQSTIFAGALDANSEGGPLSLAWYSNFPGANLDVQSHFLVVGVEGNETGLYGTSFAAPIISGYAAIVGSKFTSATPTQITNRLLETAHRDVSLGYDPYFHGQGEASILRAVAPNTIH